MWKTLTTWPKYITIRILIVTQKQKTTAHVFSKKKSILGIDIGTSSIKIAQVTHENGPVLDTYGIVNLAYQFSEKNDSHVVEKMADLLKALLVKAQITAKRSVISFPNSAVFTSVLEMPKMSPQELDSAVQFEAKKYVPLELSEVDLSWSVISPKTGEEGSQKILLTAVPKQIKNNYMQLFDLAGLSPEIAEIWSFGPYPLPYRQWAIKLCYNRYRQQKVQGLILLKKGCSVSPEIWISAAILLQIKLPTVYKSAGRGQNNLNATLA